MGGGCCGGPNIKNREIDKAVNFNDLLIILQKKYKNLSNEKKEIEEYLGNPDKKLEYIEIKDIDADTLRKRLLYIPVLEKYYQQTMILIQSTKGMDFQETKEYVHDILYYHLINYDENEEIAKSVDALRNYCDKINAKKYNNKQTAL